MNILFLTLVNLKSFEEKQNIYADQCRELVRRGHRVHIVCPDESGADTQFVPYGQDSGVLKVRTGRVQKTSLIRKGIATLLLPFRLKNAIGKQLKDCCYDLVIYSTPPITLVNVVKYVKKRDKAKTYLLLKDIFPQNAVDLGMMAKRGLKAPIYRYFRWIERRLYAISDRIGCMSPANVEYVLSHNPKLDTKVVEVCPNSFEPETVCMSREDKLTLRRQYGLPEDKTVFVYGGNLGRPQGVPFIVDCLKAMADREDSFFVVCGKGTELPALQRYAQESGQKNLLVIPGLPRQEYEDFVGCSDVGLIFLDWRFTIPNFPSRLLSYMQKSMPVIACTDPVSDVGKVAQEGGFGLYCASNDVADFVRTVDQMCGQDLEEMGRKAADYLKENYSVQAGADIILADEPVNV